ncbi:MAG: sigma-70 family RNA polymerase sigma factor [candidate division NC10 bacterium]|nr:sigma-70 family RNA polymerase sigma factor [candidate division NC10 bacterium]
MATRSSHGMISGDRDLDHELVGRVLAGDQEAFTSLLQRHQKMILNFMYRMVGERGFAEDLTQEVFLKAYDALPRFRREAAFATWLFRIAHNHCLNALRRKGREISESSLAKDPANGNPLARFADPSALPDEKLEQRELHAVVQTKLAELTPEHRAVLVLRDIQGLSYDEIASALNLEGGTVRSRIHRARMELKEKIRNYLEA